MLTQAFVSTFLTPFRPNHTHFQQLPLRTSTPATSIHSPNPSNHQIPLARTFLPSPSSALSALTVGLTALSVLLRPAPTRAHPTLPTQPSTTHSVPHPSPPPTLTSTLLITPHPANPITVSHTTSPPTGTLLRVGPTPTHDVHSESSDPLPANHSHNPASYPGSTTSLSELATATRFRPPATSDRLMRLRTRVRPAATLGLVGVGAVTSGSMFWRRAFGKREEERAGLLVEGSNEESVYCSVVCLQIPFCVPERAKLLKELTKLADAACLVNPDGMAKAASYAAHLLLEESGLLEDSSKFAPYMDVFVAENLREAERRFSAHVEIEAQRIQKLAGKKQVCDVSPTARLGEYGVVTLVIATTEGVDLECYNCGATVIQRLRRALDSVGNVREGEIAGMELMWVPETGDSRSLTRAQLATAFPALRIK